ncbi:MAG: GTP 3',8-cyclase MoaA [Peptococcaceae bacterium]
MNLQDNYGRLHDYLRISITDRCNLRCIYCMGEKGIQLLNHDNILSYEEMIRFVRTLAPLGLRKLRITGGEPLVRKDVESLIGGLSQIQGIEDIALTTNGELLPAMIDRLMENGLKRVNISLDSLQPATYKYITRRGKLNNVLEGIKIAIAKGLTPVKINVVLMGGINDTEIYDFLKLTLDDPIHVRFIEYMPLDNHDSLWLQRYLPLSTVKEKARALGYQLTPEEGLVGNGTAETWRIHGAQGTVGLINPVSCNFCATCTRLRLTADGNLKPCLFWQDEINIKNVIADPGRLISTVQQALALKHEKHLMAPNRIKNDLGHVRCMSQIGG